MKKIILLILVLSMYIGFALALQYDYNPANSPSAYAYSSNTYSELLWTDIAVTQTNQVTDVVLAYTWATDSWPSEGSFLLMSPLGTTVTVAAGQFSGTYNITLTNFQGESMNGNWRLWIQDTYGDGGHQATNITVSFHYDQAGSPGLVTNPNPANGALNIPVLGNLTWTFGADTLTYDLMFGPTGSMTQVVTDAAAGATGLYNYGPLVNDTQYSWQVIAHNTNTRLTTPGPVWTFRTSLGADMVQIGTGTDTSLLLPVYTYYGYTYSQSIYLQSEINMATQRIERIWYYWNGATAASTLSNDWVVYMGHTALTSFADGSSWIPLGNLTPVFAGTVEMPIAPGWIEIVLNLPFSYNNSDNLVVAVEENEPGYDYPYGYFQGTLTPGMRSIRYYNDGTNPDPAAPPVGTTVAGIPNIKLRFGAMPTEAVFSILPDLTTPWDFGMIPVNTYMEKLFTITNMGLGNLSITSVSTTDPYYSVIPVEPFDSDLGPTENAQFNVRYAPTTTAGIPHTATVTVTYTTGARTTYLINFTGSCYAPGTLPVAEGWESGAGSWIFVNGTQTNAFYIGTADPYEGLYSAYISNNAGASNTYTNSVTSVAHFYKDFAFDANSLEFPLSFKWKCQGESSYYDYLQVFLVDTSVVPVAGTRLSTTYQVGVNYNLQTAWQDASITLPGTLSGTVKRLVFSWWNDSSGGTNPPINIDNISLTATPAPTGPVLPPNLVYPGNGTPNMPYSGFPYQFSWNTGGSMPDVYNLYIAAVDDLPLNYTSDDFFGAATPFEDVTSPYTPAYGYTHGAHYVWTVGAYNATYPVEVYTWPPYEFIIETEVVPGSLILQGQVMAETDAYLSWTTWNGPATAPGWIYWGTGVQYDAIGTSGAAEFSVAQKFPTSILSMYNGEQLTAVKFFPYVDGTLATYTIRLWTGTDDVLAPNDPPVYEQPVPTIVANAWNEVTLTTPYTINSANALYVGYYVNTTTGYPAGCDAGPQVAGLGNLIQWSGTWSELTALNAALTYNWCIEGYVSDVVLNAKAGLSQLKLPAYSNTVDKEALRNNGFRSASGLTPEPSRALLGYNVYRDNVLLNTAGYVTESNYTDPAPGLGTFNYQVKAYYVTAELTSNIVPLTFSAVVPYDLPFVEEWNAGTFTDQAWGTTATNWAINTYDGQPAPCAIFSWSPQITNYAEYLTSHTLNGVGQTSVNLSFEMALNNYSTDAANYMAVEVWNGSTWNQVASWSSLDNAGAGWGWTYYSYDISAYAAGNVFQVRFVASGVDSYEINYWYLDNINIYTVPATLPTPVVTITEADPDVLVGWTEVPGAIWYGIYAATDPYGTYTYLGYLPATYIGAYFSAGNYEFFKVTAGAGSLPRGRMLDRGIQH